MEIIKVKRTCYRRTRFVAVDGYLDKEEINEQLLCLDLYILGIRFWKRWKIVSVEKIPMWAVIQNACLGSTDWKSKDPEMVDKWINEPIAYLLEI
jgi:hypothetical protein